MILGIDIDDTITDTSLIVKKYLNIYDPNFKDNYKELEPIFLKDFLKTYGRDIINNNKLKPYAKETLDYLYEHGYKIILITARKNDDCVNNRVELTLKYLKEKGIKYHNIEFNQENKGACANNYNVDIFIDDKESVLEDVSKYGIECLSINSRKENKFKTFKSWKELLEYIKERS